ncbi:hypothetical protein HPC49_03380 [Pyxidicoccus fallax]|uniref:Uncharacterized protein n=1 Tax=Pyxidicoccus fallax TaxID=394095 RepID=A0A848LGI5_9BACT|nr:hypothetical protein [Pyxidicoccus fallax]NMO15761.1 hypothetical protein [Pyxidicoccus fallax]NPC77299.1 hypothetical protein [Pyxidicoccus fallax]
MPLTRYACGNRGFRERLPPFEFARGVTRAHALALFDRLLAGMPHTRPVPMEELS